MSLWNIVQESLPKPVVTTKKQDVVQQKMAEARGVMSAFHTIAETGAKRRKVITQPTTFGDILSIPRRAKATPKPSEVAGETMKKHRVMLARIDYHAVSNLSPTKKEAVTEKYDLPYDIDLSPPPDTGRDIFINIREPALIYKTEVEKSIIEKYQPLDWTPDFNFPSFSLSSLPDFKIPIIVGALLIGGLYLGGKYIGGKKK